ncbi:SIMPL domain-containing protein [Costertonia aggregata]|uniref:SIMPL domain-containing protein n=1 Tax=Costertonia aggregata TaxID=343403 RepID=A0A7H9ARE5_9FLAO|nr:SIMPL domain-containing protein [Costertonia aggregata]QLG46014.1 SIMPL domain-containing protein [Costertonia aggregata]
MRYFKMLAICFMCFTAQSQNDNVMEKEFRVEGSATVRIQPNQVVLQLGLESRGKDLVATKTENSRIIAKAVAFCKAKGILEKHLQTDYIRINPSYNYNNNDLNYYSVDQYLSVTIEELGLYEEILTELLKMGINKVNNISFRTTHLKENRKKARKLAIEAAKEKAEFLATEVGIQLGNIVNIAEYSNNSYGLYGNRLLGSNISQNVVQNVTDNSDYEGLSIGMIPVSASVTLTYNVK